MHHRGTWLSFILLCLCFAAAAQFGNHQPAPGAYISKYYIAEATPGSSHETGSLHIIYSDGAEMVRDISPKKASNENEAILNQKGFSDVQLTEDRKTIGWAETYDNCCTSYAVPLAIVLYRFGGMHCHLQTGQMVWHWMFVDGGRRVAVVWGATHGPEVGDYRLYNARTCKVLAQVYGDADIQALKPDAPRWAKELEAKMHAVDETANH